MTRSAEIAKHIRKCLKREGIPARVRVSPAGQAIQVITKTYEARWTPEQLGMIAHIAICNKMTGVRGTPIDADIIVQLVDKNQFDFYPPQSS